MSLKYIHHYKQLQLFDTMAPYFNCVHAGARGQASFSHVPNSALQDTTIEIKEVDEAVYAMTPFPFRANEMTVAFAGRYILPVATGDDVHDALRSATLETQSVHLVAA